MKVKVFHCPKCSQLNTTRRSSCKRCGELFSSEIIAEETLAHEIVMSTTERVLRIILTCILVLSVLYGIHLEDVFIIGANAVALVFSVAILILRCDKYLRQKGFSAFLVLIVVFNYIVISTYKESGNNLWGRGDMEGAIREWEKVVKINITIGDRHHLSKAESYLYKIGNAYKNYLSNYPKALEHYEQALKISKEIGKEQGIKSNLRYIVEAYIKSGDYPKAREYFKKAQEAGCYIDANDKYKFRALVYRELGNYSKAIEYSEMALEVASSSWSEKISYNFTNDACKYCDTTFTAGQGTERSFHPLYCEKRNKDYQLTGYIRITIEAVGANLYDIALNYMYLGDYSKALEYFEEALEIFRELGNKNGMGNVLKNIGDIHAKFGNDPKALVYYEKALKIYTDIGNKSGGSRDLANVGDVHREQGNYEKALEFYEKSNDYVGAGSVYIDMKNYMKALDVFEKGLKQNLEVGNQRILMEAHLGMGEAYERHGRLREAAASYTNAVSIADKLRSGLNEEKHKTGYLSTAVQPYKKLVSALARLHIKGEQLTDNDILKYLGNIGEISFYVAENIKARSLIEMLASRMGAGNIYELEPSFLVESEKSRNLTEMLRSQSETGMKDKPHTNLVEKGQILADKISILKEQVEDAAFRNDNMHYKKKKNELNSLEAELEQYIYELRKSHPRYAAFKYPQPLSIKDIPITSNEILLEYHVSDEATYLFVVGQDKQKQNKLVKLIEIPISEKVLKEKVKAFRYAFEDIRYMNEFNPMKAKELYDLLLAEGVKDLPVDSHLIIIPDGILNLLPYEALVVSTDNLNSNENLDLAKDNIGGLRGVEVKGKEKESDTETVISDYKDIEYFGDKWSTSYYQSGTVLGLNRTLGKKEQKWPKPVFALGDPVFDKEDNRYVSFIEGRQGEIKLASSNIESSVRMRNIIREKGYTFQRLVETRDEVVEIGRMFGVDDPYHIKLDMEASEAGIKGTDLSGYRYIHFATHGILENEIPYIQEPALVLNLVNNENGEDGYLTMSEVMGLNLSADMVALSACKTGLGEGIGGEGIIGLTRAFMYAGSPSVVVSLWSVDSKATTDFMTVMYRYLKAGKNKDEAIKLARTDIRNEKYQHDTERAVEMVKVPEGATQKSINVADTSHPYFWAPFVLVGEWEVESSKGYEFTKEDVPTAEINVSDKKGEFEDKYEPSNVRITPKQTLPKEDISTGKEKPKDGVNRLTKNVVLQKLGKPDSISKWSTTERWSYGTSYVEFENGIFTRCYEPHGRDDLKRKLGK
jgi:pentatricopeptide repeat protein